MGKKNLMGQVEKTQVFSTFRIDESSALFIHKFAEQYFFGNSVEGLRQMIYFVKDHKKELIEYTEEKRKKAFSDDDLL